MSTQLPSPGAGSPADPVHSLTGSSGAGTPLDPAHSAAATGTAGTGSPADPAHASLPGTQATGTPFDPYRPGSTQAHEPPPVPPPPPAPWQSYKPVFLPVTYTSPYATFTYTGFYFLDDPSAIALAQFLGALGVIKRPLGVPGFSPTLENMLMFRGGLINAGLVAANFIWQTTPAAAIAAAKAEVASLL